MKAPHRYVARATRLLCLATCMVIVSPERLAVANPSSVDPDRYLVGHGTIPGAKELIRNVHELYSSGEDLAIRLQEGNMRPDRLPYKQLESFGARIWKGFRDADELTLMGEPCGRDLRAKVELIRYELQILAGNYRGTPPGKKQFDKNMQTLKRKKPRTDQALAKIAQAIQRGNLQQAEQQLIPIGQEIYSLTFMFTPTQRGPFWNTFNNTISQLDSKLNPIKRKKYFDQAKEVAGKELSAVNRFASEASRVRTEIAASGKAKVGEDDLGPAEAIRYLTDQWGAASAALIRFNAIQWAFTRKPPSEINSSTMQRVSALKTTATNALVGVVDAASVSTPPEEIPVVYSEILMALTYADRRASGSGPSKDCQPSLEQLAAKGGDFKKQVDGYELATRQPLLWRERFARKAAAKLKPGYTIATSLVGQKLKPVKSNKPAIYGPARMSDRALLTKSINHPNWAVFESAAVVLGRRVCVEDTLRLKAGSLTGLSEHTNYGYANVAVGMPIQKQVDDLRFALLVNEENGPLSIDAANAISASDFEDFEDVGGELSRLHVESAVTRFISLPDIAYKLAPLGSLPSLDDQMEAINQTCWRFDIAPHWVKHRYFTVAIPGKLPK